WARVFRDAFLEARSGFGMPREIYTGLAIAVVIIFIAMRTGRETIERFDDLLLTAKSILYVAAGSFLISLIRSPWNLHRNQQHRVAELTAARDAIAEKQKPKLAFVFESDCCPMWGSDSWGGQTYFVRIGVRNISRVAITGAVAYLSYLDSRKLRLPLPMGGGNDPQTLNSTNQHTHILPYE